MIGLEVATILLLAAAGLAKLRRRGTARSVLTTARLPGSTAVPAGLVNRGAGALELLVAIAAFCIGGRLAGLVLTLVFAALAAVSARMVRVERGQDCGCFARPTPVTQWHTAVNLAAAVIGFLALIRPSGSPLSYLGAQPLPGVAVLAGAAVLAYLAYLVMTALPDLLATVSDLEIAR